MQARQQRNKQKENSTRRQASWQASSSIASFEKIGNADSFYAQFFVDISLDTEVEHFRCRHWIGQTECLGILLQQSVHIRLAENAVGGKSELRQAIGFKRR